MKVKLAFREWVDEDDRFGRPFYDVANIRTVTVDGVKVGVLYGIAQNRATPMRPTIYRFVADKEDYESLNELSFDRIQEVREWIVRHHRSDMTPPRKTTAKQAAAANRARTNLYTAALTLRALGWADSMIQAVVADAIKASDDLDQDFPEAGKEGE